MPKRREIGVVVSDKAPKTRRVEIPRLVKHPRYKKYVRRRTVCYVHDEHEQAHLGDVVEIVESRPRSKMKRWELVRVLEKSRRVDVVALRAAARRRKEQEEQEASQPAPQTSPAQPAQPGPEEQEPPAQPEPTAQDW